MAQLWSARHTAWDADVEPAVSGAALAALEAGNVLLLEDLRFETRAREASLFTPSILGSSKNASFDPAAGRLGGTTVAGADAEMLRAFIARFSDATTALVDRLLPRYRGRLTRGRASFRPAEIAGRAATWRKDDSRLPVVAVGRFPARSEEEAQGMVAKTLEYERDRQPGPWRRRLTVLAGTGLLLLGPAPPDPTVRR